MVVMPALTQRHERNQKIVTAVVLSLVAAATPGMGQRVNAKSSVIEQNSRDGESPYQ